jgi:MFS-type transporter involved in bile tolerance (Atg22 family)
VTAYIFFLSSPQLPVIPLLLISVAETVVPTVMLAMVPLCVSVEALGVAFGLVETVDSAGSLVGNLLFGMIYEITGSYYTGLVLLTVLSVMALLLVCSLWYLDTEHVFKNREEETRPENFPYEPIS